MAYPFPQIRSKRLVHGRSSAIQGLLAKHSAHAGRSREVVPFRRDPLFTSCRRLLMEPLEPRLLLNADLTLDLTTESVEHQDNSLLIRVFEDEEIVNGQLVIERTIRILDNDNDNAVLAEGMLEEVGTVEILLGDGDDRTVIDVDSFSAPGGGEGGGAPNIVVNSGTGVDTLSIVSAHSTQWDLNKLVETDVGFVRANVEETGDGDDGDGVPAAVHVTFTGVEEIEGGDGEDTLFAPLTDNLWVLDGPGSGLLYALPLSDVPAERFVPDSFVEPSLPPESTKVSFSRMDNLVGSDRSDWFYVKPGGGVPGEIRGAPPGVEIGVDALFITKSPGNDVSVSGTAEDGGTVTVNGIVVLSYAGIDQIETVLLIERDMLQAVGTVREDDPHAAVVTGVLAVSDPDAGQAGYRVQRNTEGIYGWFSLSADGQWIYRLDNRRPVTDALAAGQTVTDTFEAESTDGTLTEVVITVAGADEVLSADTGNATIGGAMTGRVTEDDPNAGEATGTLTVTDPDEGEGVFLPLMKAAAAYGAARAAAVTTDPPTRRQIAGTYGTFALEEDGDWTYTLANDDPATDALAAEQTVIERFHVFSIDGTRGEVLITVTGAGDEAVIGGDDTGAVTEDDPHAAVAKGTLTVSDPDAGEKGFQAQAATAGTYGTFTLGARGEWIYTLDGRKAATDALAAGQTEMDTFEVLSTDGTRSEVVITVTGADEAAPRATGNATVGGVATGAVTEDDSATRATGTLTVSDPDAGEAEFQAQTDTAGTYGTFTLGSDGAWTYTLDNADPDTNALRAGQTATDILEVLTADGTRAEVVVTVTGANDTATIGGIGLEDQVLMVTLIEDSDETRRLRVLDRNDNDAVLADEVLGDIKNLVIRTGSGADTIIIDAASFADVLDSGDHFLLPRITVDTGTGRDSLVTDTSETTLAEWRLQGQGSGTVHGTLNDDDRTEFLFLSFEGVEAIRGGEGRHTLVGANHANTWQVTGEGAGSVDGYTFGNFDVLVGGGDEDHLIGPEIDASWRLTGTGAGDVVGLRMSFAGMEAITGSGANDVLTGPAANTIWRLDGPDSGTVLGIAFAGMENLTGADDHADQFYLGEHASLTGVLTGGAGGFDTLFFDETRFKSFSVNADPNEAGSGSVDLDGTVIRYSGLETPRITVEGTAQDVTLTATGSRDELVLRWSEDGTQLVLDSINGAMEDVVFDHPTGSLTIDLGGGADEITIEGFGDGKGASLYVRGGSQDLYGVDVITVADDALISTRMLTDPNGDPMTAFSIGDSGDVVLDAEDVHVRPGARILTHVVAGSRGPDTVTIPMAGAITLGDGDGGDLALDSTKTREVTIESETVVGTFNPANSVDSTANTIDFGSDHNLKTGDAVRYHADGSDVIRGLEDGRTYFAIVHTDQTIKLAEGYGSAKAGTAIEISVGGAGDGEHRLVKGVVIDASGDPGTTGGAVTIQAVARPVAVVFPLVDFHVLESRVEISGATIRGGDVSIRSEAIARTLHVDGWADGLLQQGLTLASALPAMVLSMLTGVNMAVSVRHVTAHVELSDTDVVSSGTVTINSDAQASSQARALVVSVVKTPNPVLLAVAFARTAATSETLITGTTSISAAGDVEVKAYGSSEATSIGRASNQLESIAQRKQPGRFDGARWGIGVAVANVHLTVHTTIGADAEIRSTAGNVRIVADGNSSGTSSGTSELFVGGRAFMTLGATLAFSEVKTIVDGTIYAAGAVSDDESSVFDPTATDPTSVDYERNTIHIPDHGYTTGDEVVYKAGGGDGPSPIDGLVDGETYVVLVVDADNVQLARSSPIDLHLGDANDKSTHGFLRTASTKFVLNAVDEDRDAIWLPGHSFATGDTVTYTHESAFGAIEGIEKGTRYLVEVDGDWIKLGSVGESPNAPEIELRQGDALGYHEFSTDDGKLYALELGRVDADSNTVYREKHGLGGAKWGAGAYVRAGTHGVPELDSGDQYDLEVLDENSFRLRDPATGATVDISDDGMPSEQEIAYLEKDTQKNITPDDDTVDAVSDTITISNHGWTTGQTVIYVTDAEAVTEKTVRVVDSKAPALVRTTTILVADPEIGGLRHGTAYKVIVVDGNTIRLVEIDTSVDGVQAIELSDGGVQGDEHTLTAVVEVESTGGITVSSNLTASQTTVAWGALGAIGLSPNSSLGYVGSYNDYTLAAPLLGLQFLSRMGGPLGGLSSDHKNLSDKTTRGNAGKTTFGGTATITFAQQNVVTEIGESPNTSPDLDSGMDISITATLTHYHNEFSRAWVIVSGGSSTGSSHPSQNTDKDGSGGRAVGLAGAYSVFLDDVKATVGAGATLDAAATTSITAKFEQPVQFDTDSFNVHENFETAGFDSIYVFVNGLLGLAYYALNSWVDSYVTVEGSSNEGKQPSIISMSLKVDAHLIATEAIIRSGAEINRNPIFAATAGQSVEIAAETSMIQIALTGSGDWDVLLGVGHFVTMAQSRSLGASWSPGARTSGSSVGGLVALNYLRCTTIALIEADVAISVGPSGHLNVDAREDVIAVRVAGRGAKSVNEGRAKSSGFVFLGTVVGSGHESVTRAGIESNADGVVDVKGDGDVSVNAVSDVVNIHIAGSFAVGGDGASSFGVGVVVAVVLRTTEAFIGHLSDEEDEVGDEGPEKMSIRALTINARNDGGIYSFALAASVAAGTGKNANSPKDRRPTGGELDLLDDQGLPPVDTLPAAHKNTVNQEAGGFTAAGSIGLNFVKQSTRASLNGGGTFRVSTVDISATDSTDTIMGTGGAAISYQRKESGSGGTDSGSNKSDSKSLAGSVSANFVYTAVQAFIRGVRLTSTATDGDGPEVAVRARREGNAFSFSIALAADGSSNAKAFSGSASFNFIEGVTHAFIAGAVITANGDVEVESKNTVKIWSIGGGVAGSRDTGVGASISYNHISHDTRAWIAGTGDGGHRTILILLGGLTLHAENANAIYAASVSAGVSVGEEKASGPATSGGVLPTQPSKGIAGAFTLAVNIIAPEWSIVDRAHGEDISERGVAATIDDADVVTGEDVRLTAVDNPSIVAIAGGFAIGTQAHAFGAALGWNQIKSNVRTLVTNSRITAGGALSLRAEKGTTKLAGQATITTAAIGGAGSKDGGAVGISAAVNGIISRVEAEVAGGSVIQAEGDVAIEAEDTSSINALTGAVGVSVKSYAGGAGASGNYIDNRVKAQVDDSAVRSSSGDVEISAKQEANVRAATIGVAVSAKNGIALAGSVGVQVVTIETIAGIEGTSRATAAHNVRVLAQSDLTVGAGSGQLSISGSGKFAGGAALNFTVISSRTEASIGKDAKVSTTSATGGTFDDITGKPIAGVSVEAASDVFVLGIAVGGSVGKGLGAAASGTLNVVKSVTEARVEAKGDSEDKGVDSARDVNVVAESNLFASGTAGALGAGKFGVGIGVDVGAITHRTSAYIGDGATIEADDSVFVRALAAESIVSVSVAVSGATKVAVGASAGVGVLRSRTRAYIGDRATVWARGNVLVFADSDTKSWIASASVAGAGKVAVGVGFQIGVLEKSTKAYIGDATVTALAHDDAVEVSSGAFGDALGFSGADVDAGQNRVTIDGHDLNTGDRVVYTAPTALTGLQDGTIYYVIRVDADTIRLAASRSDAENGVAVDIGTSNGSAGATHLLRRVAGDEDGDAYADFKTSAVDTVSDTISSAEGRAEGHGFVDGQEVLYFTDGVVLGGMSTEGRYYVIRVDDDSFKLAATREDALEGTAIDLDTTDLDSETGHHVKALADESLPEVDNAEADSTILSARSERETLTTQRKGVIVVAVSTNDVGTVGAGVAIAASGAGALTGAVTVHTIDTSAYIARGAAINTVNPGHHNHTAAADQDVHVNAARVYRSVNVGLAVAGAGKFAAAPAFAAPILKGATTAYIQGATSGGTYDTSVAAERDVTVTAHAESEMYAVTAGAALAVGGVSLAGSVNVVVVDTQTLASISGRVRVTAGGNVLVSASDDTRAINFAGGVGLVFKGFTGAGAVPVTVITKHTTASIGDHAIVDAAGRGENAIALAGARAWEKALREEADPDRAEELIGEVRDDQLSDDNHREVDSTSEADSSSGSPSPMRGVAVQARSSEDIHTLGASVSAGVLAGAVGITVSVTFVDSDTVAAIGPGAQINQNTLGAHENQSVDVDARNVLEIFSVAGAIGVGGFVGVGAGVDIGIVRNDTQALVGAGARIRANADVNVNAVSIWVIDSAAVGAGFSGIAGIAGGIVVYAIGGNFSDSHDQGSALSGDDGDAGGFSDTAVSNNFAQVQQEDDGASEFDPATSVDSDADTVDVGSAHGLSTGDVVLYHTGGGDAIGGLEEGEFYFAIVDSNDPGKVRLAATHEDALAGRAIDIDASSASGSTHRLSNDSKGLGDAARTENRDSLPDGRVGSAINNQGSVTSGTVAGVESGVDIRARDVNVTTLQILDVDAIGGAVAGSILVSVGVGAVVLNVDADVASYIRPGGRITGDGTGDLRVTAHSSTVLDATAYAGSLAGSVAVAASVVSVTDASSVFALLGAGLQGGNINETTGPDGALVVRGFDVVSVQARGYFHQQTLAGAVAAGGLAAGAPGLVFGSLSPEVHAVIGAYTELGSDDADTEASNVGRVSVDAFAQVDSSPVDDGISVFALGVGALGALGAGFAQIDVSPTVGATIGAGALVDADRAVRVRATADINARVNADGAAGSLVIGIGAMIGKVSITSDVRARVESRARIRASSIRIKADHAAVGRTETTPSSAGILAGTGSDARTEIGAEVEAEVGEWAVLEAQGLRDSESGEGGDIDVDAVSVTEAHADARGHSYGIVATAGVSRAYAETLSKTSVKVGEHASIESLNADVSLDARSMDQLEITSSVRGGAAIQVSEARSAGKIGGGTSENPEKGAQTVVGEGARISATRGGVDVGARYEAHADVSSDVENGGVGTGSNAESDLEVLSATQTDIGSDVTIDALNVRIRASVDSLDLSSEADADSGAVIAFTDATADTEVHSAVGVNIRSGANITGRTSVVIEALHGSLDDDDDLVGILTASDATTDVSAGFKDTDADAETVLDTETRVEVVAGAEIATLNLRVEASADPDPGFSSRARVLGSGLFGDEHEDASSQLTLNRSIDFNARVVILPAPSPFLVLDEQGREVTNVGDIDVALTGDGGVVIGDIRLSETRARDGRVQDPGIGPRQRR